MVVTARVTERPGQRRPGLGRAAPHPSHIPHSLPLARERIHDDPRAQHGVVSMVRNGFWPAFVTPDTSPAGPSYDMNAAFMQLERHERGIHAV